MSHKFTVSLILLINICHSNYTRTDAFLDGPPLIGDPVPFPDPSTPQDIALSTNGDWQTGKYVQYTIV